MWSAHIYSSAPEPTSGMDFWDAFFDQNILGQKTHEGGVKMAK